MPELNVQSKTIRSTVFTDIADWWEGKRAEALKNLDQWVEDSDYSQGVMIAAATTEAFMTIGAGFVDILRLGDGVRKGTMIGVGTDALRVVAIFPFGKTAQTIKSMRGLAGAKVIADIRGPHCFWVASAKAFAQIGQKFKGRLFASVEDVAKALGMPMNNLWRVPNLSMGMHCLRMVGARIGAVSTVSTEKDIIRMVPHDGSVVMIAVRVIRTGLPDSGHAIYAFRNAFGLVRFMDRSVGGATLTGTQGVFKSIGDIAPLYGGTLVPREAAVLHNVFVKSILHDLPRLAVPILGVIATEDKQ